MKEEADELQVVEVTSVKEYITHVETRVENNAPSVFSHLYYRGHSNHAWKIKPSIGRFTIPKSANGFDNRRNFEQSLLNAYKQRAYPYLPFIPNNDFEWLLLAQHHSLPTRFLDWSGNPLVGLYFAVENVDSNHDACVIETGYSTLQDMDPMAQHNSPFDIPDIYFLIVSQKHQRYTNQASYVSIHPERVYDKFPFSYKFVI